VRRLRSTLGLALVIASTSVVTVVAVSGNGGTTARPTLHAAVETVIGMVVLLAAFLAVVRLHTRRRLDDVLLAGALAILAASHLLFLTLPAVLEEGAQHWLWSSATGRLGGAVVLAVSAFVPDLELRDVRRTATVVAAGAAVWIVAVAIGFALAEPSLPVEVRGGGELQGTPTVFAIHVATLVAFAVAAFGYFRLWRRGAGLVAEWIGTAAALAAIARLDYLLDPSTGLSAVRVGDGLRVAVYILFVLGLERDVAARAAADAVRRERRRIARELHDGLAQELAFILRRARSSENGRELAIAAERALLESRRAIATLRRDGPEPLHRALADGLAELALRLGRTIDVDLLPSREVPPNQCEALVAIAREAVANAVRHAKADTVRVELNGVDRVCLRITDDGVGFDVGRFDGDGFGLAGMRERAQAIGASFEVSSRPGGGTAIEVVLA
jgi:signal transduction histidine kinase